MFVFLKRKFGRDKERVQERLQDSRWGESEESSKTPLEKKIFQRGKSEKQWEGKFLSLEEKHEFPKSW